MPLLRGDVIAGYRIESVIARGGMGVVYRAHQSELGRWVALKVIAAERAGDAVFRARFVREARLAASLDHPNVIPIFEAGNDGGVLFIAMRLVEGSDLERTIADAGPLEPELAVGVIAQAAAGLDAAHARGLVHRDVKPANILLAGPPGDPHVYVSDFGVAKSLAPDRPVTSSAWVGTVGYAAPEQIQGRALDARADVYALGCVLLAALTGHPPAQDGSRAGHDLPSASAGLQAVLTRALARRPADRYPTAGALAAAAREALAGTAAISTAPVSGPREAPTLTAPTRVGAPRRLRVRPLAIPALGLAVVAAVAVAVMASGGSPGSRPRMPGAATAKATTADVASGDGDVVTCQQASCTQAGRAVAAPIDGGTCRRGGAQATWTRIDRAAPEPILICLARRNPPSGGIPPPVPTLIGARLDRAELALDRLGIGHDTSGGGVFGILDAGKWAVCATSPPARAVLAGRARVRLFVDRSC